MAARARAAGPIPNCLCQGARRDAGNERQIKEGPQGIYQTNVFGANVRKYGTSTVVCFLLRSLFFFRINIYIYIYIRSYRNVYIARSRNALCV